MVRETTNARIRLDGSGGKAVPQDNVKRDGFNGHRGNCSVALFGFLKTGEPLFRGEAVCACICNYSDVLGLASGAFPDSRFFFNRGWRNLQLSFTRGERKKVWENL